MSTPVRPHDVIELVGEIDADVVAAIIATGATREEVTQAVVAAEAVVVFEDCRTATSSTRVAKVRALLEPQLRRRENNIARGRD